MIVLKTKGGSHAGTSVLEAEIRWSARAWQSREEVKSLSVHSYGAVQPKMLPDAVLGLLCSFNPGSRGGSSDFIET